MNILYRHILSKPWLINESYANSVLPEVRRMMKGESPVTMDKKERTSKYIIDPNNNVMRDKYTWDGVIDSFDAAPEGSIAVIEISGVMFKEDQACGPTGMVTLMQQAQKASRNKNIAGVILVTDTPGGQVNGTFDFSKVIKSINKPTVTYITGYCCSAGYWVGSSADYIIANNELAEIGSIGVMCTIIDDSAAMEKEGFKVITIRATNSVLKSEPYFQALAGNEAPIRAELDYINTYFAKTVTKNRKGKLADNPEILQGEVFFAKDAIKLGLIDAIGSMDDAVAYINNNSKKSKNTMATNTQARTHVNALLGVTENHASNENGVYLQESELDAIEARLAADAGLQAENTRLTAENATAAETATALATANTTIATQNTRIAELEAEVEALGKEPAHKGTHVAGTVDPIEPKPSPYVNDGSEEKAAKYNL